MHKAKREISDQRNNITRFVMQRKLTTSGAGLASEKAMSNMGRGRGNNPGQPPKKVGLAKPRLLGRMLGREAADKANNIVGYLEYGERKGGYSKAGKGLTFILRAQTQIRKDSTFVRTPQIYLSVLSFF